jgi:hypothetical protein
VVIRTEDDTYGNINQFIMSIRQLFKNPSTPFTNSGYILSGARRQYRKYNFFIQYQA